MDHRLKILGALFFTSLFCFTQQRPRFVKLIENLKKIMGPRNELVSVCRNHKLKDAKKIDKQINRKRSFLSSFKVKSSHVIKDEKEITSVWSKHFHKQKN